MTTKANPNQWAINEVRRDEKISPLIHDERERQDAKFGGRENPGAILPRVNTVEAQYAKLGVLMEEVGEVARAALEADFAGASGQLRFAHLQEELVQVAAVAVAWLESFEEDGTGISRYGQ